MPSLIISHDEFRNLPEAVQRLLLGEFLPEEKLPIAPVEQEADPDLEDAPDLSPVQAKRFVAYLGERSKEVVRHIVSYPVEGFVLSDLEAKMQTHPGGLRGCWTGITKVTRRVLDNDKALLIWWSENDVGVIEGRLSPTTYRSLRRALGYSDA